MDCIICEKSEGTIKYDGLLMDFSTGELTMGWWVCISCREKIEGKLILLEDI